MQRSYVNVSSDDKLMRAFKDEFLRAFRSQFEEDQKLFIIDLMEDLHFVNPDKMSRVFEKVDSILKRDQISLILAFDDPALPSKGSVEANMLSLCMAILNFKGYQSAGPPIDDEELKSILTRINKQDNRFEELLVRQLEAVKDIIYREEVSFTPQQKGWIHSRFSNLAQLRRDNIHESRKEKNFQRIQEEEKERYQYRPAVKSIEERNRQMLKSRKVQERKESVSRSRSGVRMRADSIGDRMYKQAQEQQKRREEMTKR